MIYGSDHIRLLLRSHPEMIVPFSEDRAKNIEGNCVDLTLGAVYSQQRQGRSNFATSIDDPDPLPFVSIGTNRKIPEPKEIFPTNVAGTRWYVLYPGVPYIIQTQETVTLPEGTQGLVLPRTSFFRGGALTSGTSVPYGFSGKLVTHFSIPSKGLSFRVEHGARIVTLMLFSVSSSGDAYNGIWSGGKIVTDGEERGF
jgi:deoxycytidine triphosphate deaminase